MSPIATATTKPVVKDAMTSSPHAIGHDQSLELAHARMRQHQVRHLPVLDGGKLVGIVSQRDLYLVESLDRFDLASVKVEEAMVEDVYRVAPSTSLEEVVTTMAARRYGCAVVMDQEKIVGVFTTTDALRTLSSLLHTDPGDSAAVASGEAPNRTPRPS